MASATSNTELAQKVLTGIRQGREFVASVSPQTRIITIIASVAIIGLPIYSFVPDPSSQMAMMTISAIVILLLAQGFMETAQLKYAMYMGWAIFYGIWMYVFSKSYIRQQDDARVGKHSFICNPTGICSVDGSAGVLNGMHPYTYTDPKTGDQTNFIPGKILKTDDPTSATYTFWLKVSYNDWRKLRQFPSPVLFKGTNDPKPLVLINNDTNTISFEYQKIPFPFDEWVHYAMVFSTNTLEVYRNGLLLKTLLMPTTMFLNKSNLYVATAAPGTKEINMVMPGKICLLDYRNIALTAGDIEQIYNRQKPLIRDLDTDQASGTKPNCDACPQDCSSTTEEDMKVQSSSLFSSLQGDFSKLEQPSSDAAMPDVKGVDEKKYNLKNLIPQDLQNYLDPSSDAHDSKSDLTTTVSGLNNRMESLYSAV